MEDVFDYPFAGSWKAQLVFALPTFLFGLLYLTYTLTIGEFSMMALGVTGLGLLGLFSAAFDYLFFSALDSIV